MIVTIHGSTAAEIREKVRQLALLSGISLAEGPGLSNIMSHSAEVEPDPVPVASETAVNLVQTTMGAVSAPSAAVVEKRKPGRRATAKETAEPTPAAVPASVDSPPAAADFSGAAELGIAAVTSPPPAITKDFLQKKLEEVSIAVSYDAAKTVIDKFGAGKWSNIKEKDYAAAVEMADGLISAKAQVQKNG